MGNAANQPRTVSWRPAFVATALLIAASLVLLAVGFTADIGAVQLLGILTAGAAPFVSIKLAFDLREDLTGSAPARAIAWLTMLVAVALLAIPVLALLVANAVSGMR
jgi:uncharacterized PurR-regulated membrane protein YhhQ (DUF165 family)